jgi:hypothetical protein
MIKHAYTYIYIYTYEIKFIVLFIYFFISYVYFKKYMNVKLIYKLCGFIVKLSIELNQVYENI